MSISSLSVDRSPRVERFNSVGLCDLLVKVLSKADLVYLLTFNIGVLKTIHDLFKLHLFMRFCSIF